MRVRAESFLGKLANAARTPPTTVWRITVPPWLAKVLVTAGTRTGSTPDATTWSPSRRGQ